MEKLDPREVEMVAIVNMQPISDELKKRIEDIESGVTEDLQIIENNEPEVEEPEEILKPGKKIRPEVTDDDAIKLVERLYGIVTSEIRELISYDDRNFLIHADRNIRNPIIPNHWHHGYVLKIQNSLDSKKENFTDAQTQMLLFLGQQNIACPKPVMNIYGKYYSSENVGGSTHVVKLLEYQPGQIFNNVPKTKHLFYQAGEFVAKVDNALKFFQHNGIKSHRSLWMLDSLPKLSEFIYVIKDAERKDIVEEVIEAFERKVLANISKFNRGIIHGDFNEQNIIVNNTPEKIDEFKVTGIIDFGDTCYSYYVFELAITMAYMMLQSGDIATGGLVIAGYGMVRIIPEIEKKVLKICVAARLCQSLVLGTYTNTLDPDNDYVLTTQAAGWDLLQKIWSEPDEKLEEIWIETADNYLKQSTK